MVKGLAIASGLVGLPIVAAIIWLLNFSPLGLFDRPLGTPEIVRFVPRQSVAAVAINAPLADVERLQRYLAPLSSRRRIRRQWQDWFSVGGNGPLSKFLAATHLQFERDFLPWLGGESLLATLSVDAEGSDYFVALSSRDVEKSSFLLNLVWQQQFLQQKTPQIDVYKGVQLLSVPVNDRNWAIGALGDRYVLFASGVEVAREAIDSWQIAELSLADSPFYQTKLSKLDRAVGLLYVNLSESGAMPDLWGWKINEMDLAEGEKSLLGIGVSNRQLKLLPAQLES